MSPVCDGVVLERSPRDPFGSQSPHSDRASAGRVTPLRPQLRFTKGDFMFAIRRRAILVTAAVVGGALLMSACQEADADTDTGASGSSSASPADGAATPSGSSAGSGRKDSEKDSEKGSGKESGKGSGQSTDKGSGADTGNGEREQVGQVCGANDISWSTKSQTQAGGYLLIVAKAKS